MIKLFTDIFLFLSSKKIFLSVTFLLFISCNQITKKDENRNFDLSLLEENNKLRNAGDYKAIFQLNKKYYKQAENIGYKDGLAHCLINFAVADISSGNYKNGIFFLERAEKLLSKSDNIPLKALLYNELASLNNVMGLTDNAETYSKKSIFYTEKSNMEDQKGYSLGKIYISRAALLDTQKKYDSAVIYYHKAIKVAPFALSEIILAQHYLSYNKNMDSARVYVNNAMKMVSQEKQLGAQQIGVYIIAGDFYMETKEYPKAETTYKAALQAMDATKNMYSEYLNYIYQKLAELYKTNGNTKEEYFYLNQYNKTKKDFDKKKEGAINLLANKFIADLKSEDKENQKRNYIYWCLGGILLIFSGLYAFWKIKKLKTNKEALKSQTEVLKDKLEDKNTEELIELARKNDSFFIIKFREVYPHFIAKLLTINPDLENSELVFCAMLKLNFSSKEIAQNMTIQHTSVQKRKSRVRKRLNISSDVDIYDFLNQLK
ncbi:hypothetical protein QWZ06_20915 [Chryseobacterium tructae]|uniref:Tetratricopeptide repeat protein n=1 Tax=Chryseobacterium tructae TaxID=1037380 RepID=A0ABV7Y0R3_9FLAO|nr:hypothetical protein [Chryseobacterium tructae]MDN3694553.1 hypothetical protein [Chryseobacterium tructae]